MLVLLSLVGFAVAAVQAAPQQGPYVWDLLPTPLNAAQVTDLFAAAVPGETFPIFSEPPKTSFTCQGKLGYYADPQAGCQAFQRCTLGGDQVTYLCPNGTLFNQLVLVCDWWFNVDCSKAPSYYNFANPRIYDQHAKLHDTPPREYVAPWQRQQLIEFQRQLEAQVQTQNQINARVVQPVASVAAPAAVYIEQQPPPQQVFVPSPAVQQPPSPPPSPLYTQSQQPTIGSSNTMFAVPQSAAVQVLQPSQNDNSQQSVIDVALQALEQKLTGNVQNQQQAVPLEQPKLDITFVPEASRQRAVSFLSPDGGVPHLSISPLALKPFYTQKAH